MRICPSRVWLALALLTTLGGCSLLSDVDELKFDLDTAGDTDTDTDTDSDSDTDTDSDGDTDTGTGECGDGDMLGDEECDDDNTEDGDGCSSDCTLEYCGDTLVGDAYGVWDFFDSGWFSPQLNWELGGWETWETTDTYQFSGSHSMRPMNVGWAGSTATIQFEQYTAGLICFHYAGHSEQNLDVFRFAIDDIEQLEASGEHTDWTEACFEPTPGVHTFRWSYEKNESNDVGWDAFHVDDVLLSGLVSEQCDDANWVAWDGCHGCTIAELQVNTETAETQGEPRVAAADDGSFVVVWHGQTVSSSNDVFGQRFDSDGAPAGAEFQVNSYTADSQRQPRVAMADDGAFVVVWESMGQDSDDSTGIYAQRYDDVGYALGGEFQVNQFYTGSQTNPDVAMADDGGFVVVWQSMGQESDDTFNGVYLRLFDASGSPHTDDVQVNTYTTGNQQNPAVAMDDVGAFVVVWQSADQDGDAGYGIFGQRFDTAGDPVGSEFHVNSWTADSQSLPTVGMDDVGAFVVAWASYGQDDWSEDNDGVFAQRFYSSGVPAGDEFQVNTYTAGSQSYPHISVADDGSFVVVWDGSDDQDGDNYGAFGQRYDSYGAVLGSEIQCNLWYVDQQWYPSVSAIADVGFVAAWESNYQDGDFGGIFAQRFDTDGEPRGALAW